MKGSGRKTGTRADGSVQEEGWGVGRKFRGGEDCRREGREEMGREYGCRGEKGKKNDEVKSKQSHQVRQATHCNRSAVLDCGSRGSRCWTVGKVPL